MDHAPSRNRIPTDARVHPKMLPYLCRVQGSSLRWAPAAVILVGATYVAASWTQGQAERALAASQREQAEAKRRNALLADAYGSRSSLEELELAMETYEAQRKE